MRPMVRGPAGRVLPLKTALPPSRRHSRQYSLWRPVHPSGSRNETPPSLESVLHGDQRSAAYTSCSRSLAKTNGTPCQRPRSAEPCCRSASHDAVDGHTEAKVVGQGVHSPAPLGPCSDQTQVHFSQPLGWSKPTQPGASWYRALMRPLNATPRAAKGLWGPAASPAPPERG